MRLIIFISLIWLSFKSFGITCKEATRGNREGETYATNGNYEYVLQKDGWFYIYGPGGQIKNSVPQFWRAKSFVLTADGSRLVLFSESSRGLIIINTAYLEAGYSLPHFLNPSQGADIFMPRGFFKPVHEAALKLSPDGKYIVLAGDTGGVSVLSVEASGVLVSVKEYQSENLRSDFIRNRKPTRSEVNWTSQSTFTVTVNGKIETYSIGEVAGDR